MTITVLPSTIITADVNPHLPLLYSLIEDHGEKLMKEIPVSTNQTCQPILPDITTASIDLHDNTSRQTLQLLTPDHLPLLNVLSIHYRN